MRTWPSISTHGHREYRSRSEEPATRPGRHAHAMIVFKRKRRLGGIDQIVLCLTARRLADWADCGALRRGLRGQGLHGRDQPGHGKGRRRADLMVLAAARNRPLYPAISVDAIMLMVHDEQATRKPFTWLCA